MPGVLQVTYYSNAGQDVEDRRNAYDMHENLSQENGSSSVPVCWSLPTVILSNSSRAASCDAHPLILHSRVAQALQIQDGDEVLFSLRDYPSNVNHRFSYCYCEAETWTRNEDRFTLQASIDPTAPFDAAVDIHSDRVQHIFDGTTHNPMGNFLRLSNGPMLKMSEQERVYRALKTPKDLKCAGMLLQVEGITDYYDDTHGAGCGFCIYAATPLSTLKPADQMVQGYRYLGDTHNPQEAVYYGLLEALLWVFRLDFQSVWIIGSADQVFRQLLMTKSDSTSSTTNVLSPSRDNNNDSLHPIAWQHSPRIQALQRKIHVLLDQARQLQIQFKFLATKETGEAMDLATRAIVQRRNETWCHWSTINYQHQRNLPFSKTMARQVSI